jgi:ribosome-associated heat shock protein Hsp15
MAAELVMAGCVRLNRAKVTKPGHVVRPDDVLTIAAGDHVRVLRVKDLGARRGPFAQACLLYEDLTPALHVAKKTVHKAGNIAKHRSL